MNTAELEPVWENNDESLKAEAERAIADVKKRKIELREELERRSLKRRMMDAYGNLVRIAKGICHLEEAGTKKMDPALASSQGNETQAGTEGDASNRDHEKLCDGDKEEEEVKYRYCFNTYFQAVAPVIIL